MKITAAQIKLLSAERDDWMRKISLKIVNGQLDNVSKSTSKNVESASSSESVANPNINELIGIKGLILRHVDSSLKNIYEGKNGEENLQLLTNFLALVQEPDKKGIQYLAEYNKFAQQENWSSLSESTFMSYFMQPLAKLISTIQLVKTGHHSMDESSAYLEIDGQYESLFQALKRIREDYENEKTFKKI